MSSVSANSRSPHRVECSRMDSRSTRGGSHVFSSEANNPKSSIAQLQALSSQIEDTRHLWLLRRRIPAPAACSAEGVTHHDKYIGLTGPVRIHTTASHAVHQRVHEGFDGRNAACLHHLNRGRMFEWL